MSETVVPGPLDRLPRAPRKPFLAPPDLSPGGWERERRASLELLSQVLAGDVENHLAVEATAMGYVSRVPFDVFNRAGTPLPKRTVVQPLPENATTLRTRRRPRPAVAPVASASSRPCPAAPRSEEASEIVAQPGGFQKSSPGPYWPADMLERWRANAP